MGGKLWSPAEEVFFWKEVVPFSNKRVGPDKINNDQRSWRELAVMMQEKMGDEALRDYTHIGLSKILILPSLVFPSTLLWLQLPLT